MNLLKSPKILIVTSGQPSLNPRLVKEADTLVDAGYNVTVLYAYWNEWGTKYDEQILPKKKWRAIRIGGDPRQKPVIYFLSRIIHKFAQILNGKFKWVYFADFAIARSSYFLIREAKKQNADLYIGHNLGALPAVIKAAKKKDKYCGFDAEDFHRFETNDDVTDSNVLLKINIEDKYLPQTDYFSGSSPLITAAYNELYPGKHSVVTILNVFSADTSVSLPVLNQSNVLRLFWFSQTIGVNRGLEDIIEALKILPERNIELHLLGHITITDKKEFINKLNAEDLKIYFHDPISPEKIVGFASQFDIGLATENNQPFNRDICLTNKIFTYIQAGLAIVASNTKAQTKLLTQYPIVGQIYQKGDVKQLAALLSGYNQDRDKLLNSRKASLMIGRTQLNWENESPKLLSAINKVFHPKFSNAG